MATEDVVTLFRVIDSLRIDNGKGQVDRVVYLSPDLEKALSQWRSIQPPQPDYLFPSRIEQKAGQPIARRTIQHLMTKYLHQAHLDGRYSCHSLRHTFASELLKRQHIDWHQRALMIDQGKGRKDRVVYLSADALDALQACLDVRPKGVPADAVFCNRKRLCSAKNHTFYRNEYPPTH
jgi:site-specific recombinase XerD